MKAGERDTEGFMIVQALKKTGYDIMKCGRQDFLQTMSLCRL